MSIVVITIIFSLWGSPKAARPGGAILNEAR